MLARCVARILLGALARSPAALALGRWSSPLSSPRRDARRPTSRVSDTLPPAVTAPLLYVRSARSATSAPFPLLSRLPSLRPFFDGTVVDGLALTRLSRARRTPSAPIRFAALFRVPPSVAAITFFDRVVVAFAPGSTAGLRRRRRAHRHELCTLRSFTSSAGRFLNATFSPTRLRRQLGGGSGPVAIPQRRARSGRAHCRPASGPRARAAPVPCRVSCGRHTDLPGVAGGTIGKEAAAGTINRGRAYVG